MKRRAAIVVFMLLSMLGLVVWGLFFCPCSEPECMSDAAMQPIGSGNLRSGEVKIIGSKTLSGVSDVQDLAYLPKIAEDSRIVPKTLPEHIYEQVQHFKNPSVPIEKRRLDLAELARKGDADSVAVLMALGNEHTYLNVSAVMALGDVKTAGVKEYLRVKLNDGDPQVLSAAVKSLAKQQGEAAVPAIAGVLKRNRKRSDGFQDVVCAACVKALAGTKSSLAIPVLDVELRETVGITLQYDYGSEVVAALLAINKVDARSVLLAYADRLTLQEQNAPDDNPMGRRYMQDKIKEARDAVKALKP